MNQPAFKKKYFLLLKTVFGLFVFLVPALLVSAQPAFRFVNGQKNQKIKFELHRNLIIVQASLNGKGPYNFLLDTGINTSLITDVSCIDSLKLIHGPKVDIAGMGAGSDLHAFFSPDVKVEIPGIVAEKLTFAVLSEDVLNLGNYVGEPVHGILGFDFFNSFSVYCNFNTLRLELSTPGSFNPTKSWQKIPLQLEGNKPYITTQINAGSGYFPVKLLIDTGAGHALSLETQSDKRLKIPEVNMPSRLGVGLSGAVNGCIGRINQLKLGNYELNNLLVSFPDSLSGQAKVTVARNGNVGLELLKRFKVVFDYQNSTLFLKKHDNLSRPFEYNMCGLEVTALPPKFRTYRVSNVHDNSPAFQAGILPGDELLTIDLQPATNFSLTQISRLFHSRSGREIELLLKRNQELIYVKVKLKRRI